jgi:hypothetical protein
MQGKPRHLPLPSFLEKYSNLKRGGNIPNVMLILKIKFKKYLSPKLKGSHQK